MSAIITEDLLKQLSLKLSGEFYYDELYKHIYATDASVYRKLPTAVAFPKDKADIKTLIAFANVHDVPLIPRTAGTSLAGQCVGEGIVVDVSRYFTRILNFDELAMTVTVEPGVIRDELNLFLKPYGLFFSPNTSTSNRCMIGGMVGNNSSGTTSIQYGVTRDKVLAMETVLSDGTDAFFSTMSSDSFKERTSHNTLEGHIYKTIYQELSNVNVQNEIQKEFPKSTIHRRNTGYAVDALIHTAVFDKTDKDINLCELLCGSEGTLAFTTSITLKLDKLPPPERIVVAAHFNSVNESMQAVLVAMKHNLYMCELMDKTILDCTVNNREQLKNRFFIEGDPGAVLLLEVCAKSLEKVEAQANTLIADLQQNGFGYAYPKLYNQDINKATALRSAGLGLLGNIVGDDKAVACIEDTAVDLKDLPNYIAEFTKMMDKYGQEAVYYAHAGAGEIHLRPILNLKKKGDVVLFKTITTEVAQLVKKYKGSFSGEHGDGIVRGAFLPLVIGNANYEVLRRIKQAFDPGNILNRGKIIDTFPMDENLRYEVNREEPEIETIMDFSDSMGILRAAEKCNGSGDCRKTYNAGGTMCPSYRATLDEKDTTRARANALREFLTNSEKLNKFDHEELRQVFDLCLSCKACSSECPSNVDIASFKAEFLYQYQKQHPPSLRTRLFANNAKYNQLGAKFPALTNAVVGSSITKKLLGIASGRSIPKLAGSTFRNWYKKNKNSFTIRDNKKGELYLFIDEFTDLYDVSIGKDALELLTGLGYMVHITEHAESGRSYISKGFLDEVKVLANKNINTFKSIIGPDKPLVGIEPSAILSFRDEYLRLADDQKAAAILAKHTFTFEEFIKNEIAKGNIDSSQFTEETKNIKIHGHCHQKALSSVEPTFAMLNLPKNYTVTIINSGCCGMAGSFGYEKEHYELSMKVGEASLFSKIREMDTATEISAPGTSCRHQIYDGTQRDAKHPITILKEALI